MKHYSIQHLFNNCKWCVCVLGQPVCILYIIIFDPIEETLIEENICLAETNWGWIATTETNCIQFDIKDEDILFELINN